MKARLPQHVQQGALLKQASSMCSTPAVLLLVGLSCSANVAQAPSDDRRLILRQSTKLTAEQEYIIRENVKDLRVAEVTQNVVPQVGEEIPSGVELYGLPSLVIEKVPQVKAFKFFITKDQIVLVSPSNTVADVIKKP
jgi:hypothetical protein